MLHRPPLGTGDAYANLESLGNILNYTVQFHITRKLHGNHSSKLMWGQYGTDSSILDKRQILY